MYVICMLVSGTNVAQRGSDWSRSCAQLQPILREVLVDDVFVPMSPLKTSILAGSWMVWLGSYRMRPTDATVICFYFMQRTRKHNKTGRNTRSTSILNPQPSCGRQRYYATPWIACPPRYEDHRYVAWWNRFWPTIVKQYNPLLTVR